MQDKNIKINDKNTFAKIENIMSKINIANI